MSTIYLDNAATTPLDPRVFEEMRPWLEERHGNPSTLHALGREARDAMDVAREKVAKSLGCLFGEITFTSSGTEAANLAIVGAALNSLEGPRKRILIGAAEHHCVLHTVKILRKLGFHPELLAVDREGKVRTEAAIDRIDDSVFLVSVQHANNETGAINSVAEIAKACRANDVLFHVDAVQTFCSLDDQLEFQPETIGCDMLSVSAHKICGPKGVGSLYLRSGVKISPLLYGGAQERDMRAGTENVSGVVGFGKAAEIGIEETYRLADRRAARDAFFDQIENEGLQIVRTVNKAECLSGHAHLFLPGTRAETMLVRLDRAGVYAGSGSACAGGSLLPSHVLTAGGWSLDEAKTALRFSFGVDNTIEEARSAAGILATEAKATTHSRT